MSSLDGSSNAPFISVVIPVYRNADHALAAVTAIGACLTPPHTRFEIVVVDDGSEDDTYKYLADHVDERIVLLRNTVNQGRSISRNLGAVSARGNVLIFLDSDCLPVDEHFVLHHVASLSENLDCSIGDVRGSGSGFWHRYQSLASQRRLRRSQHTDLSITFTSANFAVKRSVFFGVGGFDERYKSYGFEDRDFALRLLANGVRVGRNEDAAVSHNDELDLADVCRKMWEAGKTTSVLFFADHPQAYQALGYARLDVRLHPWLRPLSTALEPFRKWLIHRSARLLESDWVPFQFRASWTRLLCAASYLRGTAESRYAD